VNGHAIGRFWSRIAECDEKLVGLECPKFGNFYGEKCPTGCGEPTQSWYHVPSEWVMEAGEEVVVVVFEERGGNPRSIMFAPLAG
jgi:hypothetical protein